MKKTFSKTKIIHKNPWWDYKHDIIFNSASNIKDYYYGESNGNAIIVPITKDKKLVLIVQKRYLKNKKSVEFPSGWINKNEKPEKAAQRELQEETCYNAKNLKKIKTFEGQAGILKNTSYIFSANQLIKAPDCSIQEKGILKLKYCTPKEIDDLIQKGEIWSGQTLATWAVIRDKITKM